MFEEYYFFFSRSFFSFELRLKGKVQIFVNYGLEGVGGGFNGGTAELEMGGSGKKFGLGKIILGSVRKGKLLSANLNECRGVVAESVERLSDAPVWCNSTYVDSNCANA